jgi:flagellar basal body-associated protein FliL
VKKLLFIVVVPLIMAAVGYAAGVFLAPEPAMQAGQYTEGGSAASDAPREILYKMPLGKFIIQVMRPARIVHIRINLDVYIAGAGEFEKINGSEGRARLRDATIGIISDMAETTLWVEEGKEKDIDKEELARQIVRSLYRKFPMVRSARVNEFDTTRSARL